MAEKSFSDLARALVELDLQESVKLTRKMLATGISARDVITSHLTPGLKEVGERFQNRIYFLSELVFVANIMDQCMKILTPALEKEIEKKVPYIGKAVVGTVKGDVHDLGKNIFITLMRAAGFEVHDLGVDVPADKFIEKVKEAEADILGMSALLTTTAPYFKVVADELEKYGLRKKVYIMIGGPPLVTAEEVGADTYCDNAYLGVKKALEYMNMKKATRGTN